MTSFQKAVIDSGYMMSNREQNIAQEFFNRGANQPIPNPHNSMNQTRTSQKAKERIKLTAHHLGIYHTHQSVLDRLDANIEITEKGIVLDPVENPNEVRLKLIKELNLLFTRQLNDSGLSYSWVAELSGVLVIILANECIDFTGTSILA